MTGPKRHWNVAPSRVFWSESHKGLQVEERWQALISPTALPFSQSLIARVFFHAANSCSLRIEWSMSIRVGERWREGGALYHQIQ